MDTYEHLREEEEEDSQEESDSPSECIDIFESKIERCRNDQKMARLTVRKDRKCAMEPKHFAIFLFPG